MSGDVRGRVRGRREKLQRRWKWVYYYTVTRADGTVIWADSTCDWRKIYDLCHEKVGIVRESQRMGAQWPAWRDQVDRASGQLS